LKHLILITLSLLFVLPILMVVSISLSNEAEVVRQGYSLLPRGFDLSAYQYVFKKPETILNAYKVTIFVSFVGTFTSVFIMMMCAYSLSRRVFKWRKIINFYLFFTMLFGGGLVPKYILISQYLKLNDTVLVLILSHLVNVWYLFILRTFIKGIPESIIESASVDGAGEFRIFWSFIIPLSKPAIATVGLFMLLIYWNEWMTAMLYISNSKLYTLQYLLQRILNNLQAMLQNMDMMSASMRNGEEVPSETIRMALAVVAAGPVLFIMPFFQKYFTRGMTFGAVKE